MNYDPNQPTSGWPQDQSGPPSYGQQPSGQPQWSPTGHVPPPYGSEYVPPQQQPPYQQSQSEYVPPQQQPYQQPPYQQPQYGIPPFPNYAQPQQPKRSLRWLWITLAIVGGILVLACAGCGIFLYVAGKAAINAAGPALTAQAYYQFVKQQNYARAYALLDSNATVSIAGRSLPALNQQSFTVAAQAIDASVGPVSNFSVHTNGSDTSHLTVTVTRRSRTYDVHLTLAQLGGSWKITSLDGI